MTIQTTSLLEYKIMRMDVDMISSAMSLTISRGYTANSAYESIATFVVNIDSADLAALMSTPPASTTIYGSIRQALYQYLLDKGLVTGTII